MRLLSFTRLAAVLVVLVSAACARAVGGTDPLPAASVSVAPPSPDPRVGLKAGWFDAGEASWNMRLVSTTRPSEKFFSPTTPGDARLTNSDLAFLGNIVFQGNYSGWQAWDVSNPARPMLRQAWVCPGSQSDVTVYRNLLFVSAEATSGRVDCGIQGVEDTVSHHRARGIRVYDISDLSTPRPMATVQTCRGSHTNTLVTDPRDPANVYIYVSGSSSVRSNQELAGCSGAPMEEDPNTALFRIEVIQVPVANPSAARIVSSPRIFTGLTPAARHGETPEDSAAAAERRASRGGGAGTRPRGVTQCHDITAHPAVGLAGGACSGYGLLLDISDVRNPRRIGYVADTNFSAWHSVTFSNDGSKVLFSDEWGGGSSPRCRATDRPEWGADAIFTIHGTQMRFHSYFKLPAAQTPYENCVAHNGSLIPVPGREVMVQSWYQGGVNVFDWTDPARPFEIAYFDRGPMDATKLVQAGTWSAYWYNGYIYGSEIARGLDIYELQPSAHLTRNEIEAAKLVRLEHFNPQEQPRFVWPAAFPVARAYLDQLARGDGLPRGRLESIAADLGRAESLSGSARSAVLSPLATALSAEVSGARDGRRVRLLADVVRAMAR